MTHQTVENKDGSVTTYFSEDDMPSPSQKEAKVVEPVDKPAAKTRSQASSK
jgi:hypothetical protein